jgi:polyisoprenoid-binding protein YceI
MSTTKWTIDPAHTEIQFKAKHLMIATVTGGFTAFDGSVETEGDDFTTAKVSFTIQTASVSTNNEQRDAHLRSADFFDTDAFPTMQFAGTRIVPGDPMKLEGDLTIKGVTKPVALEMEFAGIQKDPWGNTKAGLTLSGKLNRKDWGLTWNAVLESGGMLVSEEIRIFCEVELTKN